MNNIWLDKKKQIQALENNSNMSFKNKSPTENAKISHYCIKIQCTKFRKEKSKEEMLWWVIQYKWNKLSDKSKKNIFQKNNKLKKKNIKKAKRTKNKNPIRNRKKIGTELPLLPQIHHHLHQVHKEKDHAIKNQRKRKLKSTIVQVIEANLTNNLNFTKNT
jgi:hypothetical protein